MELILFIVFFPVIKGGVMAAYYATKAYYEKRMRTCYVSEDFGRIE